MKEKSKKFKFCEVVGDNEFLSIALVDKGGEIQYANSGFASLHGYSQNEIVGIHIHTLYADKPSNLKLIDHLKLKLQKQGFYKNHEILHTDKSGNIFTMLQAEEKVDFCDSLILWTGFDVSQYKKLEKKLQERFNELKILSIAEEPLRTTQDISTIGETILNKLRRAYGVVAASIWLFNKEKQVLRCIEAASPQKENVVGWEVDFGQGFVGITAEKQKSMIINNVENDKRYFDKVAKSSGVVLRSILSVPIIRSDKLLGVIQVVSQQPNKFNQKDVKLVEMVAASASVAIENAKLHAKIEELQEKLKD